MPTAGYLFPWDVVGDPAAPDLVASLGFDHVVLAAVYHGIRALTPRHPGHRVLTAPRTAAYYALDDNRWRGRVLRPSSAGWLDCPDPFEQAVGALRAVGVPVHAWVVVNHVDLPDPVDECVVNAYGDRYPWALCPTRDAVVEYALGVVTDVAQLVGVEGIELEACGWFGYDHPGHDKVGVALSFAERYLLSLCFCTACRLRCASQGIDVEALRRQVTTALDRTFTGRRRAAEWPDEAAEIGELLGAELAGAVAALRRDVAESLRTRLAQAIRRYRPGLPILLHANPRAHRSGAFTGVEPAGAARTFDGLVVNCWTDFDPLPPSVGAGAPVYASLLAVAGLGGRPAELVARSERARVAGAAGIRLYHAGLATDADVRFIRDLTAQSLFARQSDGARPGTGPAPAGSPSPKGARQ